MVRTRPLSFATVGNPIPGASTPGQTTPLKSDAPIAASPTITGVIGVSLIPVLNPPPRGPS